MLPFLAVAFLSLFTYEMTAVSSSSTTTIEPGLLEGNGVSCTPLSTFAGTEDVQCDKDVLKTPVRFHASTTDPYDEGGFLDGFVTCGTLVRSTGARCRERVVGVCTEYKRAMEKFGVCVDDGEGTSDTR